MLYVIEDCGSLGRTPTSRHENGLYHLLKSAEENCSEELAGLIAGRNSGFDEDELVTVFNGLPARFQRGFQAMKLSTYNADYCGKSKDLEALFNSGGVRKRHLKLVLIDSIKFPEGQ